MESPDVQTIASMLQKAALHRRLVTYSRMHALFDKAVPLTVRYNLLSDALWLLSDCRHLDYGALLTLDSGLPGDDFFARFRRHRPVEFEAVMGAGSLGQSRTRRKVLADQERQRVFEHAGRSRPASAPAPS